MPKIFNKAATTMAAMADTDYFSVSIGIGTTPLVKNLPRSEMDLRWATKTYVDGVVQGLQIKPTATAATTAALATNVYANGASGVGATLTGAGLGALTVDSYAVANGDLVLVKNEVTAANNGLYTVTQKGTAGLAYILTRHADMDTTGEFSGAFVPVGSAGTTNANSLWLANPSGTVTVGTTAIPFTQLNGATDLIQGTGITISGNTISVATSYPGILDTLTTYAGAAAASHAGLLAFASDAPVLRRDNGATYDPFGPIFALTDPTLPTWAWLNQGSSTVSNSGGGVFLLSQAGANTQIRGRYIAAPATPWTRTAILLPLIPPVANSASEYPMVGMFFRESSSGKLITFAITWSGTSNYAYLENIKWSDSATQAGAYNQKNGTQAGGRGDILMQLGDDGTNLTFKLSADGVNLLQFDSRTRGDYFSVGPDQVGFFVNNYNHATDQTGVTLLSWK